MSNINLLDRVYGPLEIEQGEFKKHVDYFLKSSYDRATKGFSERDAIELDDFLLQLLTNIFAYRQDIRDGTFSEEQLNKEKQWLEILKEVNESNWFLYKHDISNLNNEEYFEELMRKKFEKTLSEEEKDDLDKYYHLKRKYIDKINKERFELIKKVFNEIIEYLYYEGVGYNVFYKGSTNCTN